MLLFDSEGNLNLKYTDHFLCSVEFFSLKFSSWSRLSQTHWPCHTLTPSILASILVSLDAVLTTLSIKFSEVVGENHKSSAACAVPSAQRWCN